MKHNPNVVSAWFRSVGIAAPVPEYRFHKIRRWKFDYAWPDKLFALEVEGGVWISGRHTRGAGFVKDMEKYNEASALGWRIIRVQPKDLLKNETADLIKRSISV